MFSPLNKLRSISSFIDLKRAFVSNTSIYRLLEPCDGCAAPYGYKHHMRLNTDTSAFSVSNVTLTLKFVLCKRQKFCGKVVIGSNALYFRLEEPCDGCAAPYGFRHIMPLTTDTKTFSVSNTCVEILFLCKLGFVW